MSLHAMVTQKLLPQMEFLFDKLLDEGRSATLDGIEVFQSGDKFLPGKLALGLVNFAMELPPDHPRLSYYLRGLERIAQWTIDDDNNTWGLYYFLLALRKLSSRGQLGQALSPGTLQNLRAKLDWRSFVRYPELTLVNLPTNYLCVAFSAARLRFLLGWEEERFGMEMLEKLIRHYQMYSGEYGFSDETEGEGRFDRYSVLLIAEICHQCIETGIPVDAQMKTWLRKAVDVVLASLNREGVGFDYGRSIGVYGDTGYLEILTVAAYVQVLSNEEKAVAYEFCCRVAVRYNEFWFDPQMRSVDLWGKGRRTDAYRGKHRIFGENLSLAQQLFYCAELWIKMGFSKRPAAALFERYLAQRPKAVLTWFARGRYERALATIRDGDRIFHLPITSGGQKKHQQNSYYPIPYCDQVIQGSPDMEYPQLVPCFTLDDGTRLMPLAFFREIEWNSAGTLTQVKFRLPVLDALGLTGPRQDERMSAVVSYHFSPGIITRKDIYTLARPLALAKIEMFFASFSGHAQISGDTVRFGSGIVETFSVTGLPIVHLESAEGQETFQSPTGAMRTNIICRIVETGLRSSFEISWTIRYRN